MKLPEVPAKGPRRWRELAEAVVKYMRATTPVAGDGVSVRELPGGMQLNARGQSGTVVARTNWRPFQLRDASEGEAHKIRVTYGEVNSIVPTGMSFGDATPFILDAVGDSGIIVLLVTVDTPGEIDNVSIYADDIGSIPADADPNFYHSLGTYFVSGGGVFYVSSGVLGSLDFELCGGVSATWNTV